MYLHIGRLNILRLSSPLTLRAMDSDSRPPSTRFMIAAPKMLPERDFLDAVHAAVILEASAAAKPLPPHRRLRNARANPTNETWYRRDIVKMLHSKLASLSRTETDEPSDVSHFAVFLINCAQHLA